MKKTYKIAEINIEIESVFDGVHDLCAEYCTNDPPDFSVRTTSEDIAREREKSARENIAEGMEVINYSDSYLETLAVYRKIADKMAEYDTILFHGSVIAVDGQAYLFTAKSGTGKSTHTRLWREYFGNRAVMINDDKPLLRVSDNGVTAYGTPWNGKHNLGENTFAPLKAVCILNRGQINKIKPLGISEAMPVLIQQMYRSGDIAALTKALSLLDRLTKNVSLYQLFCNISEDAVKTAYNGML